MNQKIGCSGWALIIVLGIALFSSTGGLILIPVGLIAVYVVVGTFKNRRPQGQHYHSNTANIPLEPTEQAKSTEVIEDKDNKETKILDYDQPDNEYYREFLNQDSNGIVNKVPSHIDKRSYDIPWYDPTTIVDEQEKLKDDIRNYRDVNHRADVRPFLIPESIVKLKTASMTEMEYVDSLNGRQFEIYVGSLLEKLGYESVTVTQSSGDQGMDIQAWKEGIGWVAFQCKHYKKPVGNRAIQEIHAGQDFRGFGKSVVVTNRTFTESAQELAYKLKVELWDREVLENKIIESNKSAYSNKQKKNKLKN